jgi:hypothetical protein
MGIAYATREDVSFALATNDTARLSASVDRAIQAASRSVESLCHRVFYPETATKVFNRDEWNSRGENLWLDNHDLISVSSVTAEGTLIAAATYDLRPPEGPPFTGIRFDGSAPNGDVSVSGVFGYRNDQLTAGTLAVAISTTSATTLTVSDGGLIGIGDVLTIDSERLQVTGRAWVTSAQTGSLTASNADVQLSVATGSAFHEGEFLLLDGEQVRVDSIAGNVLTVKRAQNGSVLAAHTTSTVYTSRVLTVVRGVLGTTAATHLISTAITKHDPPALVRAYVVALACNQLLQEAGGYARTTGAGETANAATGGGLDALRCEVRAAHGRKVRQRAI